MSSAAQPWELFHRIADSASAAVRAKLVERELTGRVRFRNVDASEQALADLRALSAAEEVPFLRISSEQSLSGATAILAWLDSFTHN